MRPSAKVDGAQTEGTRFVRLIATICTTLSVFCVKAKSDLLSLAIGHEVECAQAYKVCFYSKQIDRQPERPTWVRY